jgi:phosphopantetheinyl transferase
VSLSHAGGWAAAAAHPATRVGVDIEPAHEIPPPFARYFLSPGETSALARWPNRSTSLLAAWTIKEAVLKATGRGLSVPPSTVRIRSIGMDGGVAVMVERSEVSAACWQENGAVVAAAWDGTVDPPALSISRGKM